MKCAACKHDMVKKGGEIDLRIGGKLYLVRNVFYEECPSCGEKVLLPEISEILFKKIKNKEFVEQMINVPVLDGTYC
ncbi:MAG: type II toxin-antitoxin system MqsA family antitoxin [Proteobacteria bacterium]|nr:type II toxin-antitoxin system MqsA family antitoxin [Pseudomonadota bacterium]